MDDHYFAIMEIIGFTILFLISIYGFILMAWYWNRKGKATEAYLYLMGIYGAGSIVLFFSVFERSIANTDHDIYHCLVNSQWWSIRLLPITIVYFFITFRLSLKAYRATKYKTKKYDRREGKPK
jgi:hypothetical protein